MGMHFTVIPASEYGAELKREFARATSRITVAAMVMAWSEEMAPYFQLLLDARRRGVKVHLVYDQYSSLPFAFDRILPSREIAARVRRFQAFTQELRNIGGGVTVVGKRWSHNPFAGRQHAKITIIDDTVYTFGGTNFSSNHFRFADFMCKATDEHLRKIAEKIVELASTGVPSQNERRHLENGNTLLFDGGVPGDSIIYDTACEVASRATRVTFISQFCPSGRLAEVLRGKTDYYFNYPGNTRGVGKISNKIDQLRYGIHNSYTRPEYIHAKCLLAELPGGKRAVITGSNNFSWRGVAFGTKEIALLSHDHRFYQEVARFARHKIA